MLSSAQLQNFKAMEGFTQAESDLKAKNFSNPELLFAGSMKQKITVPLIGDVQVLFNINDGTSNAWMYLFRSADNHDSLKAIAVVKIPFLGIKSQEINVSSILDAGLTINKERSLASFQWKDSDVMSGVLKNNSEFMAFYNSHTTLDTFAIALLVNTQFPYIAKDQPYWTALMAQGSDNKACAVQAVSLETSCSTLNSVLPEIPDYKVEIFPNPSIVGAGLFINLSNNNYINASLTNLIGDVNIPIISGQLANGSYRFDIPVNSLSKGFYLVKISLENELIIKKLVIE